LPSRRPSLTSLLAALLLACALCGETFAQAAAARAADPRAAVQFFFALLKSGQYAALYDYLPAEMQQRVTREKLTESLKRLSGFIVLERMEVGRVQQRGDFAVIDTTFYGRLLRPLEMNGQKLQEGRVSVQQYLFKEQGRWKVATSDSSTRAHFLKRHPEFKRDFQFTPPQFAFKQNGQWKSFTR
jgi:hypothetical protein